MKGSLTVFVASPSDVQAERAVARSVAADLAREFSIAIDIRTNMWEDLPLDVTRGGQEQIASPRTADVVIFILWTRFGSALPPTYTKHDGTPYDSGTEFEFDEAIAGKSAGTVKLVALYRKTTERQVPLSASEDVESWNELRNQRERLCAFLDQVVPTLGTPASKGAHHTFDALSEFESKLRRHLRVIIIERLKIARSFRAPWWTTGSPYPGLEAYTEELRPVFFGRHRDAVSLLERLRAFDPEVTRPMLLLTGESGCGKSSIVAAGLIPILRQPGAIGLYATVHVCHVTRPTPATFPYDFVDEFTSAGIVPSSQLPRRRLRTLVASAAPELRDELAAVMARVAPTDGASQQHGVALVVVLDHFEGLVLDGSDNVRAHADLELLKLLLETPHVFVVACIRDDALPTFLRSAQHAWLRSHAEIAPVATPGVESITEIVTESAASVGLSFEVDDHGRSLGDQIVDDATRHRVTLALLQFALCQLYGLKSNTLLTWAAYASIGGVMGAMCAHAVAVENSLSVAQRAVAVTVFRDLLEINPEFGALVQSRWIPKELLCTTKERGEIVERLLSARVLSTRVDRTGLAVVGFAHDSLLHHWPLLGKIARDEATLIAFRTRLRGLVGPSASGDTAPSVLLSQGDLALAEDIRGRSDLALTVAERAVLEASLRAAGRRKRITRLAASALAILAVACATAWWIARERAAELRNATMLQRRDAARSEFTSGNVHRSMAHLAVAVDAGQTDAAMRLLGSVLLDHDRQLPVEGATLAAFPMPDGTAVVGTRDGYCVFLDPSRPVEQQRARASRAPITSVASDNNAEGLFVGTAAGELVHLRISDMYITGGVNASTRPIQWIRSLKTAKAVATSDVEGVVRFWKDDLSGMISDLPPVASLDEPPPADASDFPWPPRERREKDDDPDREDFIRIDSMIGGRDVGCVISASGLMLLSGIRSNQPRLHKAVPPRDTGRLLPHGSDVRCARFSADDKLLVTGCDHGTVAIWDTETGRRTRCKQSEGGDGGSVVHVSFVSGDRQIVCVNVNGLVELLEVTTLDRIRAWHVGMPVQQVCIDAKARYCLCASRSRPPEVVDLSSDAGSTVISSVTADGEMAIASDQAVAIVVSNRDVPHRVRLGPDGEQVMIPPAAGGRGRHVLASADGQVVYILRREGVITCVDVTTGVSQDIDTQRRVKSSAFSAAASSTLRVAAAGVDDGVVVVDFSREAQPAVRRCSGEKVLCVFVQDSGTVVAAMASGQINAILPSDLVTPMFKCDPKETPVAITGTGDGSVVVVVTRTEMNAINAYVTASGAVRKEAVWEGQSSAPLFSGIAPAGQIVFVNDGGEMAVIRGAGDVLGWRTRGRLYGAAMSADGTRIATGDSFGSVRVWAVASGEMLRDVSAHVGPVDAIGLDMHGDVVVTAGRDHRVLTWDAQRGGLLAALAGSKSEVDWIRVDPSIGSVLYGDAEGTVVRHRFPSYGGTMKEMAEELRRTSIYRATSDGIAPKELVHWGEFAF